ncbi:hypothetical protein BSZ19_00640 [Bradyrhizobium japonicum]|uniref:Uncharacterized protein n=1 Tax=Bradyrhizobium japonicum TaxID=375 RepID=A0A1Y2JZG3_BRAJP|nr:hypothetical protein [Bradyrhizobium japonicum]OSJ37158.1 hypothetical protein BSZ19_00640 [Bradyrhizobium japonicum]
MNWSGRLDPHLRRHEAVEAAFLDQFRRTGNFKYVLSAPIEKEDRTHFCIVYGTRSGHGLEAYRGVEYSALKSHEIVRAIAKKDRTERRTGQGVLLGPDVMLGSRILETQVADEREKAIAWLEQKILGGYVGNFKELWSVLLEKHVLRIADVKDLCVDLAMRKQIADTWSTQRKRKLQDSHIIRSPS